MTIGEKLLQLRRDKNLTQDEVAERLGVTPQAVSKWENDASCPDILRPESEPLVRIAPPSKMKSLDELILKITVDCEDNVKVRVNLPLPLVKVMMESGMLIGGDINFGAQVNLGSIDFSSVIKLAENGAMGKLIEVDADKAHIVIEVV